MWGIIPAADVGNRLQPLVLSKELLPVGSRLEGAMERPRAVSEFLVDRMVTGGAKKICFVISSGETELIDYYGGQIGSVALAYVVQPRPAGLCDALFCALPLIAPDESVLIGLPDTIWFPHDGVVQLPEGLLSFLLFPVHQPQFFDAVVTDAEDAVVEIQVRQPHPGSPWVWGAIKMPGRVLRDLHQLWRERGRKDEHLGTLVNAYLDRGGKAVGLRAGEAFLDVGAARDDRRPPGRGIPSRPSHPAGSGDREDVAPLGGPTGNENSNPFLPNPLNLRKAKP